MAVLDLGTAYYLAVTLLQASLALLIFRAGEAGSLRAGIGAVVALGAVQTTLLLGGTVGAWPLDGGAFGRIAFNAVDIAIVLLLAGLFTRIPTPLWDGWDSTRKRTAFLGMLLVLPASYAALEVVRSGPIAPLAWFRVVHGVPFLLAAVFMAFHFLPEWETLPDGPLRRSMMLAGAALGMSPVYQGTRNLMLHLVGETAPLSAVSPTTAVEQVALASMGLLAVYVLLHLARQVVRERDPGSDRALLLGLLTVPVLLGIRAPFAAEGILGQFAAQALRPVLLSLAMLRYDLFEVPRDLRRIAVPASLLFLSTVLFLTTAILASPAGIRAQGISAPAAVAAVLLVTSVGLVLREPLGDLLLTAGREGSTAAERLERYRLALEDHRAREDADEAELAELRDRYGVTRREHEVLEAILARNLVVRTRDIHGLRPGDVLTDRYEVRRELGAGGFGRALLARDQDTGDHVVVKEVQRPWEEGADRRREALRREARVGARLDDPHVAAVREVVEEGHGLYLVRAYVPGETLRETVEREGTLPPARARAVLVDVLRGLEVLHDAGLVHRDLKPGNVVLTPDDHAVLIDHGSAAHAVPEDDADATAARTRALGASGSGTGTLAWMSPEQVLGEDVGARTDLFAAGALLHHLLTGHPHVPVQGRSAYLVKQDLVRAPPAALPDHVPADLADVVRRALQRDPGDRFPSAAAFRRALEEAPAAAAGDG